MTTFITAIKLMKGYEDYATKLRLYVECIHQGCRHDHEILIVEDCNALNVARVRDSFTEQWFAERNARLIEYEANYPNPHGYNMIEAFAKNEGLKHAKFSFVCITNCDILFNAAFFEFLPSAQPRVFYRFLQFETPRVETWELNPIQETLDEAVCLNPDLKNPSKWNLKTVAYKSGDIMLMDRKSWRAIRGFPENEVWVHSDLIVCSVARNNGFTLTVPPNVRIYTYPQERALVERDFELLKTYDYWNCRRCN